MEGSLWGRSTQPRVFALQAVLLVQLLSVASLELAEFRSLRVSPPAVACLSAALWFEEAAWVDA